MDDLPTLYILCGVPFAGKTTLAATLSSTLGCERIAIDDINDERGIWNPETGLSTDEWTRSYSEAYRRIELLLAAGRSVVDDSVNFTRQLRDQLRTIANRHGAKIVVIYVDTPIEEARRRWQVNRSQLFRQDVRDEDFAQVIDQFEPPTADEHAMRYDGSRPIEEWVELAFGNRAV